MSYAPPPPPPAPLTPWWRTPAALFLFGIIVAAAIAVPVVLLLLGDDEGEPAAGSTTTAATSTSAPTTTAGTTTTTAGTTTTGSSTTTSSTTSTSTTTSTTTTSTTTTSTTTTSTTTTTAAGGLQAGLPANYQEFALTSGFLPDPWSANAQSGGAVDVSYLGGGCTGWASSPPDFQLDYTAANSSLRFYFIAGNADDDTTLIINDPSGNWVCNDDSYGTRHPTVDFTGTAPDGIYDIWIGSYAQGANISGTLYITELDANHP